MAFRGLGGALRSAAISSVISSNVNITNLFDEKAIMFGPSCKSSARRSGLANGILCQNSRKSKHAFDRRSETGDGKANVQLNWFHWLDWFDWVKSRVRGRQKTVVRESGLVDREKKKNERLRLR
jgi:hypothetical protein